MVVDPAKEEVSRRERRVTTDRLDAKTLVMRSQQLWETTHYKVVRMPSEVDENTECKMDKHFGRTLEDVLEGVIERLHAIVSGSCRVYIGLRLYPQHKACRLGSTDG